MDKASGTVLDFFNTVEDPRQRGKVLYRLDEILLIALAGCLAGADNMVEMAGWARLNLESLRSIRPFARGVPSHDTLNDVVNALDPGTFEECFDAWIGAIRPDAPDLIAIDGKTSKRTGDARTGRRPLHTLSAYAREQRLVLAQEVVDGKSNEGAMIPSLLDKLRLKGSLVTIDAAGSYRPIAERIVEAGGRLPADRQSQPAQAAGWDQGGPGAGRAGHGAALRECGNLARASGAPPLHGGAGPGRARRQDAVGGAQVRRRRHT